MLSSVRFRKGRRILEYLLEMLLRKGEELEELGKRHWAVASDETVVVLRGQCWLARVYKFEAAS